jgi:hypothetical protein
LVLPTSIARSMAAFLGSLGRTLERSESAD